MNKELHITARIDSLKLSGFDQWNPVCEAMRQLAVLSQDVQKYEAKQKAEPPEAEGKPEE